MLSQSRAWGVPTHLREDIEGGPAALPRPQRPQQRTLIHDAATGAVHYLHAAAAFGEGAVVQEPCGGRAVSGEGLPWPPPNPLTLMPALYLWWRAAAVCAP